MVSHLYHAFLTSLWGRLIDVIIGRYNFIANSENSIKKYSPWSGKNEEWFDLSPLMVSRVIDSALYIDVFGMEVPKVDC